VLGFLDRMTFGLMPASFVVTRDQISLLERDNVVSEEAIRDGRTLEGLGITPTGFDAIVPANLVRFRRRGQFDLRRNTSVAAETPDLLAPESMGPRSGFHPERAPGPAAGQRGTRA
jgi:NADH dehydrogenase